MSRVLEVLVSLVGLLLLGPLFLVIAVLVKLQDGGPVFYHARRVGQAGRLFSLLKFRSMSPEADKHSSGLTTRGDPRVTPVGRVLRRYKMDELPQLLNVLKGDMSFVGPRPEDPRFVAQYSERERDILRHKPGITSPASLAYRDEETILRGTDYSRYYVEEILPKKIALDSRYMASRDFASDIKMIVKTVWRIGQ